MNLKSAKKEEACYVGKTLEQIALLKNLFKEVIPGDGGSRAGTTNSSYN